MASVPTDKPIGTSDIEQRRAADHEGFLSHRSFLWLKAAVVLAIVAIVIYFFADVEPRPNGGTWYGYILGTIGALLIVWLSLLGIRKRKMTEGRWSLKAWTSAHVYLGLCLIVIGTLHTGFQFGWNVHTLAYALMMLVILSGIYGIWVYSALPQALSDSRKIVDDKGNVEHVTTETMVETLGSIDGQLRRAAQPLPQADANVVIATLDQDPFGFGLWTRLRNRYPRCATAAALDYFGQNSSGSKVERIIGLLTRRKTQLDQMRNYMRLKAILEIWLYVHIPATIALLAALATHIVSVFYYW